MNSLSPDDLAKKITGWNRLTPMTPLSGKHLVINSKKDTEMPLTPVSSSTQLVSRYLKYITDDIQNIQFAMSELKTHVIKVPF